MESPRSVSSVESRSRVASSIAGRSREELEKTTQGLLKKLKQKDKELKEYEKRLHSVAESQPDAIEAERQSFLRVKGELETACVEAAKEKEAAEVQSKSLSVQLEQLTSRLEECETVLAESLTEKKQLTGKLREMQDLDDALQTQVASLKDAMQSAMEERDASFDRLGEERDRRMEMESLLSNAQQQLRQMQTEMEETKKTASELPETKEEANDQEMEGVHASQQWTEALEKQLKEKETSIVELQRELQTLQATCNEAVALKDNAVNKMEAAIAQLEAHQISHEETKPIAVHDKTEEETLLSNPSIGRDLETFSPEAVSNLENRIQQQEETIASLKESLDQTREQLKDKEQDVSKLPQDQRTGHDTVEQLNGEISRLQAKVQEHQERSREYQEQAEAHASVQEENARAYKRLQDLEAVHQSLTLRTEQLSQLVEQLEADLAKERAQNEILEKERTESQTVNAGQLSELQKELKTAQKHQCTTEETIQQLETDIGHHKEALNRVSGKLEEESQSHRITRQRLNDEQETSQSLKQQLQDALSQMQASEVESWKQQETVVAQQKEKEIAYLKEKGILESEIRSLKETMTSQEKQLTGHEEEMEKVKEASESEKEKLKRAVVEVKKRLDRTSAQLKKTELEGSEIQTSHYAEKEKWVAEVSHHQHQAEKLAVELKDYKTRAHLLVKTKDEELNALKTEMQHRADVEIDLKVLREKFDDLSVERDNLREELIQANERFQVHLDDLVADFQMQIQEKTVSMLNARSQNEDLQKSIQEWQSSNEKLEETIQLKTNELQNLEEQQRSPVDSQELEKLQHQYQSTEKELKDLKEEFAAYKKTTEQMSEVQQLEMSRLIQSNLELRRQTIDDNLSTTSHRLSDNQHSSKDLPTRTDAFQFSELLEQHKEHPEGLDDGESMSESQIVALANKQAEREDTFHVLKKQNDQLQSEIEDLVKELELHREQEAVLKSALREADQLKQQMRTEPPENMDFQYLKNTVIKLMTTGESEALLPVLGKLLHFTEDETKQLTVSIQDLKVASLKPYPPIICSIREREKQRQLEPVV